MEAFVQIANRSRQQTQGDQSDKKTYCGENRNEKCAGPYFAPMIHSVLLDL